MEGSAGLASGLANNVSAVRTALEVAGVVFLAPGEATDGGAGVRLRPQASDHPKPIGPATDAVDAMDAAITKDRSRSAPPAGKRLASVKETGEEIPQEEWERFEAAGKSPPAGAGTKRTKRRKDDG